MLEIGADERRRARGAIDRLGGRSTVTVRVEDGPPRQEGVPIADHEAGVRWIADWLRAAVTGDGRPLAVDAVGHRVVHGGERFVEPTPIDDTVLGAIEALIELAPLHNAPGLAGIRACRTILGRRVPMVAVFDTAFHATLPEPAARYAIPWELAERYGIRRYGFHGISYRYVLSRYCELTRTPIAEATLVALHLGNGASVTAIRQGKSVDTSMGFTPLEGLVMGTRSGDLDPALVAYLARREGVEATEVEAWLNERSGLLGVSGVSRDMRDLLERSPADPRARLAVDLFCYRARKYVGAYLAALGGADALVFTAGIGEHTPEIRRRICEAMAWCGLELDPGRNLAMVGQEGVISADRSRMRALVIPTDEERVIARDTAACLARTRPLDVGGRRPEAP